MLAVNIKNELQKRASNGNAPVKLSKDMTIVEMVTAMEPEIKKALPTFITPERFTRMAISAINNTPELRSCTPISFIAALMNAAQLGLEPNTPLGQAYLIPYQNKTKGITECQFQLGYKGMIGLAYRTNQLQIIQAQIVRKNDTFEYCYGLNSDLVHKPSADERGEITFIYGLFKLTNGGYGFEVSSKAEMDIFASKYSKTIGSKCSPWKTNYEDMAKKTIIKRALKYAPISVDFQKALTMDESIKNELADDMSEVKNDCTEETYEQQDVQEVIY
ncbi:MAG: recombinase RecT [Clostridiales bacterium]|nr:recombinase RecT [Clostridiales bacterium]